MPLPRCHTDHGPAGGCIWCCDQCDRDEHQCHTCGDIVGHNANVCDRPECLVLSDPDDCPFCKPTIRCRYHTLP